jgi:hypothetical protein
MARLTSTQIDLLRQLVEGNHITYSQDGEVGWLWPSNVRLEKIGISDAELHDLRARKLIAMRQDEIDECTRFSPPDVITEAGRLALKQEA